MNLTLTAFPEDAGLSSRGLMRYLDAVQASGLEHHAILVARHGKLAARMCFAPYDETMPHMLFSLSKTFTSAAAGYAVAEGLLDWDSRAADVLAADVPEDADPLLKKVTLHHLLTMTSGLEESSDRTQTDAWAREVMGHAFAHEPGEWFHYNSHGTYLVSKMVQTVTGQTVRDWLMPRLFEPLGIPAPDFDLSPEGVCCGGWGLHLSAESILRMGQCMLDGGRWEGRQVLPPVWLERASRKQADNSNGHPDPENEWHQGYGYQIWRTRGNRFRGDGMLGQLCMVSPDLDMAVAVTAAAKDMGKEMQLLHEYLFPAAEMEPAPEEERRAFREREASLCCGWPSDDGSGHCPEGVWSWEDGSVALRQDGRRVVLTLVRKELPAPALWVFGLDEPYAGNLENIGPGPMHFLRKAGWEKGALRLMSRSPEGPAVLLITLTPGADGLRMAVSGTFCEEGEQLLTPAREGV